MSDNHIVHPPMQFNLATVEMHLVQIVAVDDEQM